MNMYVPLHRDYLDRGETNDRRNHRRECSICGERNCAKHLIETQKYPRQVVETLASRPILDSVHAGQKFGDWRVVSGDRGKHKYTKKARCQCIHCKEILYIDILTLQEGVPKCICSL